MNCCRACRSAYGTCLTNNQCRCHRIAAMEDHNGITYKDPTANEAIRNIMRRNNKTRKR